MRRPVLTLLLVTSVATLVAIPTWWLATRPDTSAGSLKGLGLEVPPALSPPPKTSRPGFAARRAAARAPAVVVPVRSARVEDLPRRTAPAPVSLRIPALDVDAPVVPVGVERATGEMELPPDNATAAWYRFGASPGRAGSAVIAGHVDYGEGRAVFFRLSELEPGNRIVVGYGNGTSRAFRVVARRLVDKDALPARIFASDGRPLLTLVTCGGSYDADRRRYLGNTLVFAVPVTRRAA
jgi:LPXTG-site transpeptidase (sortase) family protein